jgi:hypothetical protein
MIQELAADCFRDRSLRIQERASNSLGIAGYRRTCLIKNILYLEMTEFGICLQHQRDRAGNFGSSPGRSAESPAMSARSLRA